MKLSKKLFTKSNNCDILTISVSLVRISMLKILNIFLNVCVKMIDIVAVMSRIFDVCNQKERRVVCSAYVT